MPLDKARSVLASAFGHSGFRPGQAEVIEHLLSGGDALVLMPTGSGKSVCYQVPALVLDGLTLVLSPLIALMKDQVDALKRRGIDAEFVNSSLGRREREARYAGIREGRYRILYVTPERFRKGEFLEALSGRRVALVAVDEAHCISEWGHDFRPEYTRLGEIRRLVGCPPTVALTATATPRVQASIVEHLGLARDRVRTFNRGIDRPNLRLEVERVWGVDEKLDHIVRIARENPGSGIVYFALIKTLTAFSERLAAAGVAHLTYHGSLEPGPRRSIQDEFMSGGGGLILATNAFGMGVDKEDIRFVVHAELPGSMESYYQEIGRAGRDGKRSVCSLLYEQSDLETQMMFIAWANPSAEYYGRAHHLLVERRDEANAFGLEWLREQLHDKHRSDRRLETALKMLERYGATEGALETQDLAVVAALPAPLADPRRLDEKLANDRQKLYALVEYVREDGDRKAFIARYFGVAPGPPEC
jgi:ATP-dependent DNA helicase RecQ